MKTSDFNMIVTKVTVFLVMLSRAIGLPLQSNFTNKLETHSISDEGQCSPHMNQSKRLCPDLPATCCCIRKRDVISMQINASDFAREYTSGEEQAKYIVFCTAIRRIPFISLEPSELILHRTNITSLKSTSFNKTQLAKLKFFKITNDDYLEIIDARTFSGLSKLSTIYIDSVKKLMFISESAFSGLPNLREVYVQGTGLPFVQGFSRLGEPSGVHLTITFSHNQWLKKIQTKAFYNLSKRVTLIKMTWNPSLSVVEDYAFNGSHVDILVMADNSALTTLSPLAFAGTKSLKQLSISNTPVTSLPTAGLHNLKVLYAGGVPNMVRFPSTFELPNLQEAELTYTYHCCALNANKEYGFGEVFHKDIRERPQMYNCDTGEEVVAGGQWFTKPDSNDFRSSSPEEHPEEASYHEGFINPTNETELGGFTFGGYDTYGEEGSGSSFGIYPGLEFIEHRSLSEDYSYGDGSQYFRESEDPNSSDLESWSSVTVSPQELSEGSNAVRLCYKDNNGVLKEWIHRDTLKCKPEADLFSPCENLLGNQELVAISWMVAWLAVLGNFFVVFMLLAMALDRTRAHQRHLTVPKFLILNLAIGDFCMGLYVLALTAMDGKSSDEYYKYGVEWQIGGGCDVVGFLSVFASQLSVYTLSVISLERWYAIRYAIQLDKRLTLKGGRLVMLVGWIASIFLATLPLLGINSYRKTAICLPMEVENDVGKAYVAVLLSLDIVAFIVVVGSYLGMYMIVRPVKASRVKLPDFFRLQQKKTSIDCNKSKRRRREGAFGVLDKRAADARVAKKMAVLVFTDFACFFPICFFSLFALAGLPLVSMSTAKIVLVTCYPFNACCNPFLYAILTKHFRKDVKTFIKSHKRCCWKGDDRQRISSKKLDFRRAEFGSRQEERRKTIQVYVDIDAESPQGEVGFMSLQPRSNSWGTKATFVKSKRGSYASGHFSTPKGGSLSRNGSKKSKKHGSSPSSRRQSRSKSKSTNSVNSSTTSEESISKQLAWFTVFSRFGFSIFKRKNRLAAKTAESESHHNSFETQTTAATAATTLCDKTENEPSETDPVVGKDVKQNLASSERTVKF